MTLWKLRLSVFSIWAASFLLAMALVLVAHLVPGSDFSSRLIPEGVKGVMAIWIAPLTCFATFWFKPDAKKSAMNADVRPEQCWGALGISVLYVCFAVAMVVWPVYLVKSEFIKAMAEYTQFALFMSPLGIAPVAWLTGQVAKESNGVEAGQSC